MGIILGRRERRSLGPTFAEPPIPPFLGADVYGHNTHIGPDKALTVSTVWRCVSLLSNAVSLLPLTAYRLSPAGVPSKQSNVPLLTNPSGDMTQSEWLHMLMVSLLLRGNAYGRVTARDSYLRPLQIDLLSPDNLVIDVDKITGKVKYLLGPQRLDITADIWHVRGMTMPGAKVGLSPIAYAAASIGINIGSRKFGADFFDGGGIPKATLTTDQVVNTDQARTLKDRMLAATRNREPLVLGQGITYQAISVAPEESQFLQTQQATVSEIAGFFGPTLPSMVGGNDGSTMTYTNREQRAVDFLTFDVGWWLKRIQDAVFMLLPTPVYAEFETGALLRTDSETQAKVDNMQLAGKVRTPSEIRQRDGLPPMTPAQQTEADMVPLTVTPLGGVKALPALKAPPGPAAPVPVADQQTEGVPSG